MKEIDCIICASTERNFIYKYKRRGKYFNLVQCKKCGLFYTFPQLSFEEFVNWYPEDYYSYSPYLLRPFLATEKTDGFIEKIKSSIKKQVLKRCYGYTFDEKASIFLHFPKFIFRAIEHYISVFIRFPPFMPNGKILDIGCGSGEYLFTMKQLGWDTYGVDLNEKACLYARERGIKVTTGTIESISFPSDFFDVIRFGNVLEHIPDPFSVLELTRRYLKKEGLLIIEVPNIHCVERIFFRKYWSPWSIPTHLFHFTEDSLTQLLHKAKFKIKKIRYLAYITLIENIVDLFFSRIDKSFIFDISLYQGFKRLWYSNIALTIRCVLLPLGYMFALFKKSGMMVIYAKK